MYLIYKSSLHLIVCVVQYVEEVCLELLRTLVALQHLLNEGESLQGRLHGRVVRLLLQELKQGCRLLYEGEPPQGRVVRLLLQELKQGRCVFSPRN